MACCNQTGNYTHQRMRKTMTITILISDTREHQN
jgi:hypothetical protein